MKDGKRRHDENQDRGEDTRDLRHQKGKTFEEKTGEIFKLKGFEVELNRHIGGNEIDVLAKRKKDFGNKYLFYICECKHWNKKITKTTINKYEGVLKGVKGKLEKENIYGDFELIIVSNVGFTNQAHEAAGGHDFIITTYDELLKGLMNFDTYLSSIKQQYESDTLRDHYIEQDVFPEKEETEYNSFQFLDKWLKEKY